jgi:polysaccharide export outer membrane protein
VDKLNELESEQHTMAADDDNAEKAHLQRVIADTQAQIEALTNRRNAEEGGIEQETSQASKIKSLTDRGFAVEGRLLEQRRLTLMAQGKMFETTAMLASTNRLLEDYRYKLRNLDQTRRLSLVKDLQDATIAAAAAEARLSAVRLQLNVKGGGNQPAYVIYRENDDARIRIDADEDFDVQPGDIIEVRFGAVAALAAQ